MPNTKWQIQGLALANCNCDWGCPCQFNSVPTSGQCEAVWAMRIDEGHFGDTRLDGLVWGVLLWWPGAVHEGNGKQRAASRLLSLAYIANTCRSGFSREKLWNRG